MRTTDRTPLRRLVVGLLIAGLVWILGFGAPATALVAEPSVASSSGVSAAQPPDEEGDTGDEPGDEEDEETPDDETDEDGDEPEPEPEPGNVPVVAWIGAGVLVLAAIAWAVNVARD